MLFTSPRLIEQGVEVLYNLPEDSAAIVDESGVRFASLAAYRACRGAVAAGRLSLGDFRRMIQKGSMP